MGATGRIEIHVKGQRGQIPLSPDNYDIKEVMSILSSIEPMLYPNHRGKRPLIAYHLESGSVRHIFAVTKQVEVEFAAALMLISSTNSIDSLELPTAKAFEQIQNTALKKNYDFEFLTSDNPKPLLSITPLTKYYRSEALWVDAELYFYGTLTDAGGKDKSNIHLDTADAGTLVISADKEILKNEDRNLLYKEYGVLARGKQNAETGEIDASTLRLVKIIDYSTKYDEDYLNGLIDKVGSRYKGIDVDEYVGKLRGDYA